MHKNRIEAERRRSEARARSRKVREEERRGRNQTEEDEEERDRGPKLGPELRQRSPERKDLDRLVPEERSLVHAIKEEAWKSRPINWLALGQEIFYNELSQADYMNLADLWGEIEAEKELSEDFLAPPGSPMISE
jgi:hypothetical protein